MRQKQTEKAFAKESTHKKGTVVNAVYDFTLILFLYHHIKPHLITRMDDLKLIQYCRRVISFFLSRSVAPLKPMIA